MASSPLDAEHRSSPTPTPTPTPNPNPGLLQRLSSLEHSLHSLLSSKKRVNSQQHLLHLEKQLETCSSPRMRSKTGSISPPACPSAFQMPLHYPRYSKADYESMPEWQLDHLLLEYGLPLPASLQEKRSTAIGTFLWPSQRY